MTFAEYNTDAIYDDNNSSLEELVKIGKNEGKTVEEIKASLSPKWQKSKYIDQIDNYYGSKKEQKAPEPKAKVEATQNAAKAVVQKQKDIKQSDEDYMNRNNAIANKAQETETQKAAEDANERFDAVFNDIEKLGHGYKKIDDHFLEQLPRSVFAHYKSGDFGEVGSKEAKQRLAGFIISQFGSSLKTLSNGLMQMGGRSPLFADTTSDWEKFQQTNLGKGMENRWRKYEAETQGAIDLLQKEGMDELDIRNGIAKIATNNRLQTAFNMMNENQKAYLIQLTEEIGDKIGSFDNEKLVNFLVGSAISGDKLTWQEAAEIAAAKFGKDLFKGKYEEQLNGIKNGLGDAKDAVAGVGPSGNNLKEYTTIDGDKLSFNLIESADGKQRLKDEAQKLVNKYHNGEIDVDTFRQYYTPLFEEGNKHVGTKLFNADEMIKKTSQNHLVTISGEFDDLNEKAKNGEISPSEYAEKFEELREQAIKWGADAKNLKAIDKNRLSQEKILKAANKKTK